MTFYGRHLMVEAVGTYHVVSSDQDNFVQSANPHLMVSRSQHTVLVEDLRGLGVDERSNFW